MKHCNSTVVQGLHINKLNVLLFLAWKCGTIYNISGIVSIPKCVRSQTALPWTCRAAFAEWMVGWCGRLCGREYHIQIITWHWVLYSQRLGALMHQLPLALNVCSRTHWDYRRWEIGWWETAILPHSTISFVPSPPHLSANSTRNSNQSFSVHVSTRVG